jgi:hypothetical protein
MTDRLALFDRGRLRINRVTSLHSIHIRWDFDLSTVVLTMEEYIRPEVTQPEYFYTPKSQCYPFGY